MNEIDYEIGFTKIFPDESTCIAHIEKLRWNGIVISPFHENSKIYYCKNNKYKCEQSGRYFNAKTNTIFQNSKIELQKWFYAIWLISSENKPISSVALSKKIGITQKSAWYMMKKISLFFDLKTQHTPFNTKIENIEVVVESDKLKMTEWLNLLKNNK